MHEPVPPAHLPGRLDPTARGLAASSMLHCLLVLLVAVAHPWRAPPPPPMPIPVDLVEPAEQTVAPPAPPVAQLPRQPAKVASIRALPATRRVPLPPAADIDELSARLSRLAQLRRPDADGVAVEAADSADGARGRTATFAVKDYLRAQIERHWTLSSALPRGADWVVAIHLVLAGDGSIARAEIVDSPRFHADAAYHDFALSARNAVLASAPLRVPAGAFDIARDIVIDFAAKQATR